MNTATVAPHGHQHEMSQASRMVSGAVWGLVAGLVFAMLSMASLCVRGNPRVPQNGAQGIGDCPHRA